MVYPRLLAVNVPYRRKFPLQRVWWFAHSVFQHKSQTKISLMDDLGAKKVDGYTLAFVGLEIVKCLPFQKMALPDVA